MEHATVIRGYVLELLEKYDTLTTQEKKDYLERILELLNEECETLGEENYFEEEYL